MAGRSTATPTEWGSPIDRFRPTGLYKLGAFISFGFLLAAVAGHVTLKVLDESRPRQATLPLHQRNALLEFLEKEGTACCVIIPGMIGTFAFPYFFFNAMRMRTSGVEVYEAGFTTRNVQNIQLVFPWHEITEIRGYHYENTTSYNALAGYGYLIRRSDGLVHQLELSELQREEELAQLLKDKTLKYLLPAALASLQNEGSYEQGYLRVTRQGLAIAEQVIPWSSIQSVQSSWKNLRIQGQDADGQVDIIGVGFVSQTADGVSLNFHLGYQPCIHDLGNLHIINALAESMLQNRKTADGAS